MITLEEKRESEKKAARQLGFEDGLFQGQLISEAKEKRLKRVVSALVSAGRNNEIAEAVLDEERLDELASELGVD